MRRGFLAELMRRAMARASSEVDYVIGRTAERASYRAPRVNIEAPVVKREDERHRWEEWDDLTTRVEEKPKHDPIRDQLLAATSTSAGLIALEFTKNTSYGGRDYLAGTVGWVDRWWAYIFLSRGRAVISRKIPKRTAPKARWEGTRASGQKKTGEPKAPANLLRARPGSKRV